MNRFVLIWACLCLSAGTSSSPWEHYGGDPGGKRYVAESQITSENVRLLEPAWQFRTGDTTHGDGYFGRRSSFKATPILFDDKLVFSSGFNRVYALDPMSGRLIWRFDPKVDFSIRYSEMFTSRGVSAWRDNNPDGECSHRIFLGTLDSRLIAVNARTGEPCQSFGRRGEIDLSKGIANFRRGEYSLTSPVTVVNDVVVVGSSVGDNGGVELDSGVVRGFDAVTGKLLWRWNPIPVAPKDTGAQTWSHVGRLKTGAANVWSVMSADLENNRVFLPTTSPAPDFFGGKRLGNNLFANSVVALDARTGKRLWHFQTVHHDLWDYDIASQPLLMSLNLHRANETRSVVVQATKMGHVFVLDAGTGEPVFDVIERQVPQTDVTGEVAAPTQRFPTKPAPLHDQEVNLWAYTPEHLAFCKNLLKGVRYEGIFTPPSLEGTLIFPGNGGGTNWGSMAAHELKQIAVVAINRLPTVVSLIPRKDYDRRRRDQSRGISVQFTGQSGTPYGMSRFDLYNPNTGLPCLEGPWGELIALDISSGKIRWRRPLGYFPGMEDHPEAANWGGLAAGGPMITSSGLVFIAPRFNKELIIKGISDGETLKTLELPAQAHATPMSYTVNGTQFVVIAAGGESEEDTPGDYVVAFKLPEASR